MIKKYKNIEEILERGQQLVGKTIRENLNEMDIPIEYNSKNKGAIGQKIELLFGLENDSKRSPDFKELGVELKSTAAKRKKNGKYTAKERMSITNMSFSEPAIDDFFQSHVYEKLKKMIMVIYEKDETKADVLDNKILYVGTFNPTEDDMKIILDDYNYIIKEQKEGRMHLMSEGHTTYLGLCRKHVDDMRPQYYNPSVKAEKRNFCLKSKYTKKYISKILEGLSVAN